jgi:hypothetical protein
MIRKKDIECFRKVIDISVRFTLIETSCEERIKQYFDRRLKELSVLSIR